MILGKADILWLISQHSSMFCHHAYTHAFLFFQCMCYLLLSPFWSTSLGAGCLWLSESVREELHVPFLSACLFIPSLFMKIQWGTYTGMRNISVLTIIILVDVPEPGRGDIHHIQGIYFLCLWLLPKKLCWPEYVQMSCCVTTHGIFPLSECSCWNIGSRMY